MATSKSRLGRGLGALISSGTAAPKAEIHAPAVTTGAKPTEATALPGALSGYREIAVHLIEPDGRVTRAADSGVHNRQRHAAGRDLRRQRSQQVRAGLNVKGGGFVQ